ncbi:DNA-binding transcriptional regulator, LysR family [Amycolatopsis marina]|uniref:DNA-binding transcriptional regulator, LysR family n=1 Tax=Amycolatopsis marina TaxID=490629 RepID=A0A1I0W015_9PSEU|nr:LysR family transcriptional regulator [Amycolatopsis marina]SFA81266.1 DNA-binding transcriptional regulator, LysR family [Amycolatopsis marina]
MMDLRRLRVLRVLAERGTVTATAEALHLTPSAVSQQLRQLSRELGVELLRPDGRRVQLSPAARVLLEHTDRLYEQWEQVRAEIAVSEGVPRGRLGMCAVSSAIAALLAPAVTRLRAVYPELRVFISEEESADCFQLLLTEESDIAVILPTPDTPPMTDPRFEHRSLLEDPQDLLVPRGHRLAREDGVELADAAGERWIVKQRHNDTFPLLLAACAAAGFTPDVAHSAKEWFAVSALVAEGLGVCLLPRLVPIPERYPVMRVPLRGSPIPARRIVACVRRGSAEQPAVAAGLRVLGEVAGVE